ncbi:hypothetical protein M6D81_15075 [Paenibacillus sp. J5C_2022]|uniref:GAP1-N2 domain-containing protein n=1 Tax=Paenibacillus sp. J5C2022 TaxID=2977129 RepID=UPI0021D2FAC1|nr:hypothetical protein [Paenibacillus sp. J5C2022]MCU6710017.1 hypothetical protein [Paenibacillus sp. J5C2022]
MADNKPRAAVQQQMYTRERCGIFRSTEGYDTIAKSEGLDAGFVKKVLHPLCVYDAPASLATDGVKEENAYPESIHLLHLDGGSIVLGRSIYKGADFTGLRSTFFTHNYILPAGAAGGTGAGDYRSWLSARFVDSYAIESGMELQELLALPQADAGEEEEVSGTVLAELGFGEREFKALLHAVMQSLAGKKKVYVALHVPIARLSHEAKRLLRVLYRCLPRAYRETLGFITYSKEPVSRKGIHLTFVEPGSLRAGDRETEKEYVIDMASGRMMNIDVEKLEYPYLHYAWSAVERGLELEDFHQYADKMLEGMDGNSALSPATYHDLAELYAAAEHGDERLGRLDCPLLGRALPYLRTPDAMESKIQLHDLLLARFDLYYDSLMQGEIPGEDVISLYLQYYGIVGKLMENKLVGFMVLAVTNADRSGDEEAVAHLYDVIESDESLAVAFFRKVVEEARFAERLFFPYLARKLKEVQLHNWTGLLMEWGRSFPRIFQYEQLYATARDSLGAKLAKERQTLAAASLLLEQLLHVEAGSKQGGGKADIGAVGLGKELELTVYDTLLSGIRFDRLTRHELANAEFLGDSKRLRRWNEGLREPGRMAASRKLRALYAWFVQSESGESLFHGLEPDEAQSVQGIGRDLLAGGLREEEFDRLVPAFLQGPLWETVNYDELFNFLHEQCVEKDTIYRFILWSETSPYFMRTRGFVPAYRSSLHRYFSKQDRAALKSRANWKNFFNGSGDKLKGVLKEIQLEQSPPLVRLLRKNRKGTLLLSVAGAGVVLVVVGIVMSLSGKDEPVITPDQPSTTEVSPAPTPDAGQEPGTTQQPTQGTDASPTPTPSAGVGADMEETAEPSPTPSPGLGVTGPDRTTRPDASDEAATDGQ